MGFFTNVSLLLLVLDTSDAQTCFKPDPIEHAVLNPTHRDTEEFNNNTMIAYDCVPGYNIKGTSRERTCDSGGWSEIRFSCTLRTCSYVAPPDNGRHLDWNRGAGEHTHFVCNRGYKLKGPAEMLCLINSKWKPSNPPICEPILCPELRYIRNGRVSQVSGGEMRNVYESETVYKCNSGYLVVNTMVNQVTRRCQDDGSWSGNEPVCDVPRCEKIQPFYGGKVTFLGERKRWTQAFYVCEDSYSLFPASVDFFSECSDDLEWTPPPPQCKKKAIAKIPKHGYKSRGNKILLHRDSYTLTCHKDYEFYSGSFLDQSSVQIKNVNGTLTPEVPTCREERCDPADMYKTIVTHENGTRTRTKVRSQTNVHVSCKDRFEFYSTKDLSVNIRCVKGTFRGAPTCREKRCLLSGYPDNADTVHRISKSDHSLLAPDERIRPRQKIEVSCRNDEYELYVDSTNTYLDEFTTLCRYGKFDVRKESFPVCLEKRCLFTSTSNACFWINDDDTHNCKKQGEFKIRSGTSVNLKCESGYTLYRSENGMSENVTHNPVIVCNKGNYFAGYKCIPEYVIQKLTDFADSTAGKLRDIIDQSTCRFSMFGYSYFGSCKDPCIIPEVQNGFAKLKDFGDKVTGQVSHGKVITIQCNVDYKRSKQITSTCTYGDWDNEDWPQCTPNPCELTFHTAIIFWKDSKLLSGNEGTKIVLVNGTTIHLKCHDGYMLKAKTPSKPKYIGNERKYSTCILGRWTRIYTCDEAPCTVPVVDHATLRSKAVKTYNNKEKATFICDDGFHFKQTLSSKVILHESTCRLGNWTSIPGQCKPDSCNISLKLGSKYFSTVTNDEITTAGLEDHDATIKIECLEYYDLFDNKENIILDKDVVAIAVCHRGKWRNTYFCNQQCVTFNITHGRLMRGNQSVTTSQNITHGNQLSVECDSDTDLSVTITCNNGKWMNLPFCAISTTHNAEIHETATEVTISGCKLSDDARFTYKDKDFNDVAPGTMIVSGTVLSVSCTTIDLYVFYTEKIDYDAEDVVITCTDHILSKPEIECINFVPNTCTELEHGNVKTMSDYYEVSCDPGYSLNLFQPDKPQCDCVDGVLKCTYGGQKPSCSPDDCVVPYDIDNRLSIFNRFRVSLSSGSTVNVGDHVIFNCSKVDEQKYEPLNRRFKCVNGQWLEDEKDKKWEFGNNGTFPKCREAACEPACENLGVCHKDDKCKCKHLTTGERCETVLCDPECNKNGGQCMGPGVCGDCPVGQRGMNCELLGCKLPDRAAEVYSPRQIYATGETIPSSKFNCPDKHMLSSSNGMECLEHGIWSYIITCVKEATYLIRVQTVKDNHKHVGTNIYIYLNGEDGSTNKINLSESFTSGVLAETRKSEKDIRPIKSVRIGHDGSGKSDDWNLEFVSVYVEDVNEYYVFRQQTARWVFKDEDLTLNLRNAFNEVCINTFGDRLKWYPKDWRKVENMQLGKGLSERECKQRCTEQIQQQCSGVIHVDSDRNCFGFSSVDQRYFTKTESRLHSFFIKNCIQV